MRAWRFFPCHCATPFTQSVHDKTLVNNAGHGTSAPFLKTDFSLWQSMMDVNLHGTYRCTHAVLAACWILVGAASVSERAYPWETAYIRRCIREFQSCIRTTGSEWIGGLTRGGGPEYGSAQG